MKKQMLLEKFIKMVLETRDLPGSLVLKGPFTGAKDEGEYSITRDFPLHVTPEMAQLIGVDQDDLVDGSLLEDHEITLNIGVHYAKGTFKGDLESPPDGDEFDVEEWTPVTLDGLTLSKGDAALVKAYIGELTPREIDMMYELYIDKQGDSFDEPDYGDEF